MAMVKVKFSDFISLINSLIIVIAFEFNNPIQHQPHEITKDHQTIIFTIMAIILYFLAITFYLMILKNSIAYKNNN